MMHAKDNPDAWRTVKDHKNQREARRRKQDHYRGLNYEYHLRAPDYNFSKIHPETTFVLLTPLYLQAGSARFTMEASECFKANRKFQQHQPQHAKA